MFFCIIYLGSICFPFPTCALHHERAGETILLTQGWVSQHGSCKPEGAVLISHLATNSTAAQA